MLYDFDRKDITHFLAAGYAPKYSHDLGYHLCKVVPLENGKIRNCIYHLTLEGYLFALQEN